MSLLLLFAGAGTQATPVVPGLEAGLIALSVLQGGLRLEARSPDVTLTAIGAPAIQLEADIIDVALEVRTGAPRVDAGKRKPGH